VVDNALRSNYLLAVSLGLLSGDRARRSVEPPGATCCARSLTEPGPLPLRPLAGPQQPGVLLNDPEHPYSALEGDEDSVESRLP